MQTAVLEMIQHFQPPACDMGHRRAVAANESSRMANKSGQIVSLPACSLHSLSELFGESLGPVYREPGLGLRLRLLWLRSAKCQCVFAGENGSIALVIHARQRTRIDLERDLNRKSVV